MLPGLDVSRPVVENLFSRNILLGKSYYQLSFFSEEFANIWMWSDILHSLHFLLPGALYSEFANDEWICTDVITNGKPFI